MAKKIKIDLVGGIGNQLFIYCAGYYLSILRNVEFQPRLTTPAFGDSKHNSNINDLTINPLAKEIGSINTRITRIISKIVMIVARKVKIINSIIGRNVYISKHVGYDADLTFTKANHIQGYFQTFKYIEKISSIEPDFLKLENRLTSNWYKSKLQEIESVQSIGMHIRGGDYLQNQNQNIGSLSFKYYQNALKMIEEDTKSHFKIYVFTDDETHATSILSNLNVTNEIEVISPPRGSKPNESLLLMSKTNIKVISNSTFAWWAGYLGSKSELVIAPENWFKKLEDPEYLIPDHWKKTTSDWITFESEKREKNYDF